MSSTPTLEQQLSKVATPMDPAPQESNETPSEDTKRCHELQSQILNVLEQLRDDQRDYLSLQRARWGLAHDIPRISRELWESDADAWVGLDSHASWTDMQPGKLFLEILVPDTTNLQTAKLIFEQWVRRPGAYFAHWNKDFLVNAGGLTEYQIRNGEYQWPDTWEVFNEWYWDFNESKHDKNVCCRSTVACVAPSNFGDMSNFEWAYYTSTYGGTKDLPKTLKSNRNICGIIVQFSISRHFDIIDLGNAAAIICLVINEVAKFHPTRGPEFLDGHIAEWRERSENARSAVIYASLPNDCSLPFTGGHKMVLSGVFMHYMRSFIVVNRNEKVTPMKLHGPGLKCCREYITFEGFYNATKTKLIEKRYSTVVRLLPLQKPAGHYSLISICDGQEEDVQLMFERSPGGLKRAPIFWKGHGIYPAGLYTGISMFQFQIHLFIDPWEQDWTSTIKRIDEMVSLKLNVLENDKNLRKLVLENSTNASVLYFKVLQILNNFSDMVRAAPAYLDTLSNDARDQVIVEEKFNESYPYTENTQAIIQHNWKIVSERQRDASSRILAKLERTTNEVKSLQSGLFNVQSITEARKSRVINKYLLVFTIVTILFLPPTFVATFFGMHIFDADTIVTTQKIFWVVLGALSGGTYLLAALGLFGSNLSTEEREKWETNFRESANGKTGNLMAWFENTKRRIRAKVAQAPQV
ncbi:hypothetical protein F4782DRAFT_549407 [Xylaria castorea]|nr:hypothetical protein F4782DRAFT_549407 [Xylaria castorea]